MTPRTPKEPFSDTHPHADTQYMVHQLQLGVSAERFDRAMSLAARDMGGAYDRSRGVIRLLPSMARPGDRTFPYEIEVHYRKFPCGMLIRNLSESSPGSGTPCVSFDVIPRVPGDPRHSRIYKSFQGDASQAKPLFVKFLVWLKLISRALHEYVHRSSAVDFSRLANLDSVERVANAWRVARGSDDPR